MHVGVDFLTESKTIATETKIWLTFICKWMCVCVSFKNKNYIKYIPHSADVLRVYLTYTSRIDCVNVCKHRVYVFAAASKQSYLPWVYAI